MLTVPIRPAPEIQADLIESGLRAANTHIFEQNKIWARYSDEKADIAESLMGIMRRFGKTLPHDKPLRALSIGSSSEPQFRLLEAGFRGGLYLFDKEPAALDVVNEKIARQQIRNVTTVHGDYTERFSDPRTAANTLIDDLGGHRFELITLHHALYYADPAQWQALIEALVQSVLAPDGVIHIVLMSPEDQRLGTTTCLYNTFARRFFDHENRQDLLQLKQDLISGDVLKDDELVFEPRDVRFIADDFEKLMSVIWMIMLYPDTHDYSLAQRREITAYVRDNFWLDGRPLLQVQDSLSIYRGRCALH
ncbi:MAG: class I SAM-dependent methyltransferase [Stappiaceae bacterium]